MLVLPKARLVYLATPKTASQAIRAMLAAHSETPETARQFPHLNAATYARRWAPFLKETLGFAPETFAVMREPMEQMESWFRYRQREALIGHANSTHGMSFAEFVEARLSDPQPPFAAVGRQDRFLGFLDGGPPVTHVFDYARLDRMIAFLQGRLGTSLTLEARNVSAPAAAGAADLPPALVKRFRTAHAAEFALYARVAAKGHLITRG
ncbi:gamma-glutamyl kinase [Tabrizicola sp. TH137]|uniref:sulfotransferase family 2 domain-containing protein n=1 Tax=Tabrizicola sp. TH137 TaxID=2067452 RepID=UPI000C7B86AC|nr:sulfotransferase family 2 domain-containing protein [Tabrizicola sp. TH137]PLL11077.1 gamma-glutamyl kinase [Tabrizicola sp. TH137]